MLAIEKNEIVLFEEMLIDLEIVIESEIRRRK